MSRTRARIETISGLGLLQRICTTTSTPTSTTTPPSNEELQELLTALSKIQSHLLAGLITTSTLDAASKRLFPSSSSSSSSIPEFLDATLTALKDENESDETREEIRSQLLKIRTLCQEVIEREESKEEEWKRQNPREAGWEEELRGFGVVLDSVFSVQTQTLPSIIPSKEEETASQAKETTSEDQNGEKEQDFQAQASSEEAEEAHWASIEHTSTFLLSFLRSQPISATIIAKSNIEKSVHKILDAFHMIDRNGVTRRWPGDWESAERCWGVLDMVGSGLQFLKVLEKRVAGTGQEKPTTKSVFLLKSAPPAVFIFASSNQEWILRRLRETKHSIVDVALYKDDLINRADESRWNSVFQKLESLEQFLDEEGRAASARTIRDSEIDEVIKQLCDRLETLHCDGGPEEDQAQYALMHVSWELAMRIRSAFDATTVSR